METCSQLCRRHSLLLSPTKNVRVNRISQLPEATLENTDTSKLLQCIIKEHY